MNRFLSAKLLIALAALAVSAPMTAHAALSEMYIFSNNASTVRTFDGNLAGSKSVGIRLTAITDTTISSLGFIDIKDSPINNSNDWYHGANPADTIHGYYEMGIWRHPISGPTTFVGRTTVGPNSTLMGDFRYSGILDPVSLSQTTITILAGESFTIGVFLPASTPDAWLISNVHLNTTSVSGAGSGRVDASTSLIMPSSFDMTPGGGVYSIVNASSTLVPVPEPASLGLLITGSAALLMRRRRR